MPCFPVSFLSHQVGGEGGGEEDLGALMALEDAQAEAAALVARNAALEAQLASAGQTLHLKVRDAEGARVLAEAARASAEARADGHASAHATTQAAALAATKQVRCSFLLFASILFFAHLFFCLRLDD